MPTAKLTPVFPLRTVLFPGGPLPLRIFETRYIDMISYCMREKSAFAVCAITEGDDVDTIGFHDVGTLAMIRDFEQLPEGLLGILAVGEQRVRLHEQQKQGDGLNLAKVELLPEERPAAVPAEDEDMQVLLRELLEQLPEFYRDIPRQLDDASWLGYRLSEILPLSLSQKQYFLEIEDPLRRLQILRPLLASLQMIEDGTDSGAAH